MHKTTSAVRVLAVAPIRYPRSTFWAVFTLALAAWTAAVASFVLLVGITVVQFAMAASIIIGGEDHLDRADRPDRSDTARPGGVTGG